MRSGNANYSNQSAGVGPACDGCMRQSEALDERNVDVCVLLRMWEEAMIEMWHNAVWYWSPSFSFSSASLCSFLERRSRFQKRVTYVGNALLEVNCASRNGYRTKAVLLLCTRHMILSITPPDHLVAPIGSFMCDLLEQIVFFRWHF